MQEELSLQDAQQLLQRFTCVGTPPLSIAFDKTQVRTALRLMVERSDYQIFGICADSLDEGTRALYTYLQALGHGGEPSIPPTEGSLYIKFNALNGRCHSEPYTGAHRGVLVSCQSAFADGVNETFGHLPLDLFASN